MTLTIMMKMLKPSKNLWIKSKIKIIISLQLFKMARNNHLQHSMKVAKRVMTKKAGWSTTTTMIIIQSGMAMPTPLRTLKNHPLVCYQKWNNSQVWWIQLFKEVKNRWCQWWVAQASNSLKMPCWRITSNIKPTLGSNWSHNNIS